MKKLNKEQFIERINKIFGENYFDYLILDYKDAHTKVSLICNKCGNIETKDPSVFYRGYGCLKCTVRRDNPKRITKEQFLERSIKIHGIRYDYSKINYIDLNTGVDIICPIHGLFNQLPLIHLYAKSNCPECHVSQGEERIGIWLNNNDIKYKFQHRIKIINSYHYFDFYIESLNTIIEFNGKQHYKPIKFFGGDKGFVVLQERDKLKAQFCQDENIKLITISYKDINNIEEILKIKL